jgi:hypothetical protein
MDALPIDFHPHLASPIKGEGHESEKPSPLMGEGWVGVMPGEDRRKTA